MKNNTVLYQETEGRYEDKHVHYASFESGKPDRRNHRGRHLRAGAEHPSGRG